MSDKLTELIKWMEEKIALERLVPDFTDYSICQTLEECIAKAKELQAEPDQVKWAVVDKDHVCFSVDDAEQLLRHVDNPDYVIHKIIEP